MSNNNLSVVKPFICHDLITYFWCILKYEQNTKCLKDIFIMLSSFTNLVFKEMTKNYAVFILFAAIPENLGR